MFPVQNERHMMKMVKTVLSFLVPILMVGCATFPAMEGTGNGRLIIFSDLVYNEGTGPWWDYQLFARHKETGERVVLRVTTGRNMSYHLSREMIPGEYEFYEWNSVSKRSNRAHDHDIHGAFTIKPDAITVFDKEFIVTLDEHLQNFNFESRSYLFRDERMVELKKTHPEVSHWDLFWEITPKVLF